MMSQTKSDEKVEEPCGIVLNRMYVGDYLTNNLGHEVINLFKADNNCHYIYLNSTGNLAKEHSKKIGNMLFVKYFDKGLVEIIGMATGLEEVTGVAMQLCRDRKFNGVDEEIWALQKEFIAKEEGGIYYGGVSILDIFNDAEQQSIFVTYKAQKVCRIKSSIHRYIRYSNATENCGANLPSDEVVQLEEHQQAKASLKQYIYPTESNDYAELLALINDNSLWDDVKKVNPRSLFMKSVRKVSLFDICQIQNDENIFSNALAYFMERPEYFNLWEAFFAKYGIRLSGKLSVTREESAKIEDEKWDHDSKPNGGRVDLIIRDSQNIIVIENKIKSDINTKATDGVDITQLNRYVNYIEWVVKTKYQQKKPITHFIILTPKYNEPTIKDSSMKEIYKIITYADLYDFLYEHILNFYNDINFVAFFESMERHTHKNVNDYLYNEMLEKFYQRINTK